MTLFCGENSSFARETLAVEGLASRMAFLHFQIPEILISWPIVEYNILPTSDGFQRRKKSLTHLFV